MSTKQNAPMAVILAGGEGKRLRPLTATTPKPLLPVLGKPLLFHILKRLETMGVQEAYVMTGYLSQRIETALAGYDGALKPICIKEPKPMGSAGCLSLVPQMKDKTECIVVSGDAYFEFDLRSAIELRREKDAAAVLCLASVENPQGLGLVQCERDGRICDFVEKPSWPSVRADLANTGIYVLGKEAIALTLSGGGCLDFGKDIFPILMKRSLPMYGTIAEGYWCDVGTPEAYRMCNMRLSGNDTVLGNSVKLSATAQLRESVLMDGVQVGAGATVKAAVVAENVIIGQGVTISPGAVVGASVVIGDRSRIGEGVILDAGTIVAARSILSADFCMGTQGYFSEGVLMLQPKDAYRCGYRVGRALGACAGSGGKIAVMRPYKKGRGEFQQGFVQGVLDAGNDLLDLGWGFVAKASFGAATLGCAFTVFVKEEEEDVAVHLFDEDGLYPDACFERRFTDFVRELPPACEERSEVQLCKDLDQRYCAALCAGAENMNLQGLHVSVHPADSAAGELLVKALRKLGATVNEHSELVLYLDESGSRLRATAYGMQIGYWQIYTALVLEQLKRDGLVFLPYCCPEYIKKTVQSAGGHAVYYTLYPFHDGEKHIRSRLKRQQPFATDALFAAMRFVSLLGRGNLRASCLASICDGISVAEEDISLSDGEKLKVILRCKHDFDGEGILRRHREGYVRLRACADGRMHLMAEAADSMDAAFLMEKIKKEIYKTDV